MKLCMQTLFIEVAKTFSNRYCYIICCYIISIWYLWKLLWCILQLSILLKQRKPRQFWVPFHRCGWLKETQWLWAVRLEAPLQAGDSTGTRLPPTVLSWYMCYMRTGDILYSWSQTASVELEAPTLSAQLLLDTQGFMCAEQREESQPITQSSANLSHSGSQVR